MTENGIELDLQVVPRASREGLGPAVGDRIKARVFAPPVDGEANEALRGLVAKALGVPRGAVRVLRGEAGRRKTLHVLGDPQALAERVGALLGEAG